MVKENQILHKGTRVIDNESDTLADMNIFPGDKLWVIDSEIHENRDIAGNYDLLSDAFNIKEKNRIFLVCAGIWVKVPPKEVGFSSF